MTITTIITVCQWHILVCYIERACYKLIYHYHSNNSMFVLNVDDEPSDIDELSPQFIKQACISDPSDNQINNHHDDSSYKVATGKIGELDDQDIALIFNGAYGGWTESDWSQVSVRGKNYSSDRVKISAGPHLFRCEALHLFNTGAEKLYHISARSNSYANQRYQRLITQRAKLRGKPVVQDENLIETEADLLNPLIIINFVTPLGQNRNCNLVLYFTRRRHSAQSKKCSWTELGSTNTSTPTQQQRNIMLTGSPSGKQKQHIRTQSRHSWYDSDRLHAFDILLKQLLDGSDLFRDTRLKCIPRVADGGWLAKKVVSGTPAILGQKIKQHYYRDVQRNYLEIDVDLNSSMVAGKILSVVNGQAASLVVDISFILQGELHNELPECLLSGVRLIHLKLDKFPNYTEVID